MVFSLLPSFTLPSRGIGAQANERNHCDRAGKPYHLLREDQDQIPRPCACPLFPRLPSASRVHSAPAWWSPCPTLPALPLARGKVVPSPGAVPRHLGENVVFGETAKLCDCMKVNTIYLHLLSSPRTKGHHCGAQPPHPCPPAQLQWQRRQGLRLSNVSPFVPDY